MDWLEFSVTSDSEAAEAIIELFNRYGRGGAVVEVPVDCFEHELAAAAPARVVIKTYLPLDGTAAEPRQRIEQGLWHLAQILPFPPPVVRELAEKDWANAWKQQYHPIRVGQRILIVPAWESPPTTIADVVILLEPGMAFGTGLHPTTRQCLDALERSLVPGASVLDVGTGSGVLAIAAAKLGARHVLALDSDPVAVAVARDNLVRNGVADRVQVQHGSLSGGESPAWAARFESGGDPVLLAHGEFDVVLVNILAPVIIGMAAALASRTGPAGRVIAAGLIESQEADVRSAFLAHGLEVVGRAQEADWVSLVARRR